MNRSPETLGKLEMLVSSLFFGTIGFVTHYIDLPSVVIVAIRGIIAVLFLLILSRFLKTPISRDDIGSNLLVLIIGGICQALNWYFLFEAYSLTLLSNAVICYNMGPVLLLIITPLLLKEKVTSYNVICVIMAAIGVLLVSGIATSQMPTGDDLTGIVCALVAAVFEISVIVVNRKLRSISAIDRTAFQMFISFLILGALTLFTVDTGSLILDARSVVLMIYLGVFCTGIAFTLYFAGISVMKSQSVALFLFLEPAIGLALSIIILGDPVDIFGAIGMIMVLGSTLISQYFDSRSAHSESDD